MRSVATPALVLLLAVLCCGGTVTAEPAGSNNAALDQIAKHCLEIDNNVSSYPSALKDFSMGKEDGVETLYGPRNEPQKLVVQIVGDNGGSVREYYFSEGSLIYLVAVEQTYGGANNAAASTLTEDRYYLVDGRVERWLHRSPKEAGELREMQPTFEKLTALSTDLNRQASRWIDFLASPLTDFETFIATAPPAQHS